MTVELASALAGPLAALILKSWLGDTASDIGGNLLKLAFAKFKDWSEARAALQRAEKIAQAVVADLEVFFASERVNPQQLEIAAFELAQTIREKIDAAFLVHKRLRIEDIERGILAARPAEAIYDPAEPEHGLYIRLVQALAPRLRSVAPELKDFQLERDTALLDGMAQVAADTPRILRDLKLVREGTERTEAVVKELATRDERVRLEYETIYREAVSKALDYVEILGLDIDRNRRETKISIAYLSLTTNSAKLGKVDYETLLWSLPLFGNRLLIEGAAGSGKSTLLRWTAVQVANASRAEEGTIVISRRHYYSSNYLKSLMSLSEDENMDLRRSEFDAMSAKIRSWFQGSVIPRVPLHTMKDMDFLPLHTMKDTDFAPFVRFIQSMSERSWRLQGKVPFLIRLRHLKNGLSSPEDLPNHLSSAISKPPKDWVSDLLRKGEALLLLDGVDEVPGGAGHGMQC